MRPGPVLRYPGSKWSIARWIVSHFPQHTVYLEPFFGSGSVLFSKPRSQVETVNDVDGQIVNLFRVIRERPAELAALVEMTPWARAELHECRSRTGDELEDARRMLVECWQSFGAKRGERTGWKYVVRALRGENPAGEWCRIPERILAVAERLRGVQIECLPAVELIGRYRSPEVLVYADPPYLPSLRDRRRLYALEMTEAEHAALLDVLDAHPGPVVLSGYESELYDRRLRAWVRRTRMTRAVNNEPRQEVLWLNPAAAAGVSRQLFAEEGSAAAEAGAGWAETETGRERA